MLHGLIIKLYFILVLKMFVPRSLRTRPTAKASTKRLRPASNSFLDNLSTEKEEVAAATSNAAESAGVGNYFSYYGRRNGFLDQRIDPRLVLLPQDQIDNKSVLDVGCNTGLVALSLALHSNPKLVVGIDVDPKLIVKAKKDRAAVAASISKDRKEIGYYPITAQLLLAPLPIIEHANTPGFPHNLDFRVSNFVTDPLIPSQKFDTVLALSITKWIHVKHGDAGLRLFFKKCWTVLNKGGVLIVEPQAWDGYDKAARKNDGLREFADSATVKRKSRLSLRPDDFPTLLINEIGFSSFERLGTSFNPMQQKGFQREMIMFVK
ncbi:UNVERIFIED_CONTAM: hypothetical protein HDU68_004379 [Siphonaria sp. JEL0065]|nr:hypothetical protein HDU68_004379 [Siphonaria sp. JEL0065]